jgi:hypothetical protein
MRQCQPLHLVIVDAFGLGMDAVMHEVVKLAGAVQVETVRKVATVVEFQPQHGIPGFEEGEIDGLVGLCA